MSNTADYVSYFRPAIDAMEGYVPGEQPKGKDILKLNTNESPFPPAPGVASMLETFEAERLRLYPDPLAMEIRAEIGALFGLSYENVIAGNGSDDILNIAIRCFCDETRPMAILDPTYSLYTTLAALQGTECIKIPLNSTDFSMPDDILEKAERANLLIITRPNAPTGNSFPRSVMHNICANFKGVVLIDEAYADFASDNCADFVKKYSNVIVARTFSKSRCLAGLRFGYAIACQELIYGMMKMKDSYNVSMLTQKLALASWWDRNYFYDCIAKIKLAREMLFLGLLDLGFKVIESETNFLFASPPDGDALGYFQKLRANNIIVRYFPGPVTGKYVRISIGTEQQISRLFMLTKEIYSGKLF